MTTSRHAFRPPGLGSLLLVVGFLALASVSTACAGGGDERIRVMAAASMTDALVEIGEDFEETSGAAVEFSFGGSNTLAGQIENGAPADAAIFAGQPPMDRLEEAGLLAPGTRVDVLRNRLVVIGREDMAPLESLGQIADSTGRIALADPELAPAGAYTREALRSAGLWDQLSDRLIPTSDVRAAAAAVESGNAEYGFAYSSDAAVISGVTEIMSVPQRLYTPITYPVAVLARADHPDGAREFIRYLASDEAGPVLRRFGFSPIGDAPD